ncbi:O-antigen ligase family protein [Neobacillus sp. SAB-20_R2A]|uniref:O-antigen ligase family protein n=1 Tax=Neobacillus sp. SAB-20_R2A TaxID=3120519 RepID=UPI003C6DFA9C
MYWFLLLFPLIIFPWGLESFSTIPKLFSLYLFVLSTLVILAYNRKYWVQNIQKRLTIAEKIICVLLLLIGVSTIFSINKTVAVIGFPTRFEGFLSLFSYCCIFLFSMRLMNAKQFKKIIPGFIAVSIILSVYGILQHYSLDFLPTNNPSNSSYIRSYGLFGNPNCYGSYLVLILLLSICLFFSEKGNKIKRFIFFTSCLTFLVMLFTGTRSSWVGLCFGLIFFTVFVILRRRYLWKRYSILLISFFTIFIIVNSTEDGSYFNRFNSIISDSSKVLKKEETTGQEGSYRMFIWQKSLPLVKEYFWVGTGPDSFIFAFPNGDKETKEIFGDIKVDKAHNEYLQMAVTLGVPALCVYFLLLFVILRKAFQATRLIRGNEKIMLYGLISTIIGYLAQAFFNISVVTVAPIYWSILGITYGLSIHFLNNAKSQNHKETKTTEVSKIAMIN